MRIVYVEDEAGTRFLASEKMAHLAALPTAELAEEIKKVFGLADEPKAKHEEEVAP